MFYTLRILPVLALIQLSLLGKALPYLLPSSKENTLWIVKATPKGESLKLEVAEKVKFDFSGRVITAHPSKPLLYVTATGGDPGKVPGAVVFLNKDGSYQNIRILTSMTVPAT